MFSLWRGKKAVRGELIGDLDVMSRRPVFIRYKGREYEVKALTNFEYARMCAIIKEIEDETAKSGDPEIVDELYTELLLTAMPTLGKWRIRRMAAIDASAMVTWIIKHYGGDVEKKKTAE